ncbi:MAG: hypothetical protein ACREJC_17975, partial [Tepidisphaeraceae bacterium]
MASGIVESSQSSESGGSEQTPSTVSRSKLVQRLLAAGSDLPAFLMHLLEAQGVVVLGTEAAGFLIESSEEEGFTLRPVAHLRPDNSTQEVRSAAIRAFQDIVRPCVVQQKNGAIELDDRNAGSNAEPQFCLVTLLRSDGQVVAVSAVITR